jgi:mannose/fructose/N-acetylgalactosamine-specific phosphotransferase system component IIC
MNEDLNVPVYSFWPLFLAIGVILTAIGVVSTIAISVLGLLLLVASIIGWTWENRAEGQESENE